MLGVPAITDSVGAPGNAPGQAAARLTVVAVIPYATQDATTVAPGTHQSAAPQLTRRVFLTR